MSTDSAKLFEEYKEVRSYLAWTDEDRQRVNKVRDILEPNLPGIVDDFYTEIQRQPNISRVLTGGPEQIKRLKGTLTAWLQDLFGAPHDVAYVERHYRAGQKHVEIGLQQFYVNGGLSRIRAGLLRVLFAKAPESIDLAATVESLNKALDLDLTLIDLAYRHASTRKQDQVAAQLREALSRADAASQARSAFLANMSHEIRTPINVVVGMTELLLDSPLNPQQRDRLEIVQDSSDALLSLINDILDYSRIQQERLDLEQIEFDLKGSMNSCLNAMATQAEAKGLQLISDIPAQLPSQVTGDPHRFRQVLVNLIGNAVKFTTIGHVAVRARSIPPQNGDSILLKVEVSDTGVGISPEKRDYIFDAFEQSDPSIARKFGGTGLGLAITQNLIEMMGGTIEFESELDQGTTFTITIPFQTAATEQTSRRMEPAGPRNVATPRVTGLHILLAEDQYYNQVLATALLEKANHSTAIASNGIEACQMLERESFDLVLMDVRMPEMDGLKATRQIRQSEDGTGRHTPIIAMTAEAMPGDEEACLEAGMDAYLSKPIRSKELFGAIDSLFAQPKPTADVLTDSDSPGRNEKPVSPGSAGSDEFDWTTALDAVNGNRGLLQRIVRAFLEEYGTLVVQLEHACESQDQHGLQLVAHGVKGAMRTLGANGVGDIAAEIESMAGNNEWQHSAEKVSLLRNELERLIPQFEELANGTQAGSTVAVRPEHAQRARG